MPAATPDDLEARLRDLPAHGTRLPDLHGDPGDAGQLWAFDVNAAPYRLHFHPAATRGRAMRRFLTLQALQKAGVAAPRAVAVLKGFRLGGESGDAVITAPGGDPVRLSDALVADPPGDPPTRRAMLDGAVAVVRGLSRAGLTHGRLTLDSFAVAPDADGRPVVSLADVMPVASGRPRGRDLASLDDDASRFATRTERLRAWRSLTGTDRPPAKRRPDQFGDLGVLLTPPPPRDVATRLNSGGWSGLAVGRPVFPQRHSAMNDLVVTPADWRAAWIDLLGRLDAGGLPSIKRDASGDVLSADLSLGGRTVAVVVKRPRRKRALTHALDALRPTRARRSFARTWNLLHRGLPAERPLLLMERRRLGYVVDAVAVFERVPGVTLASLPLDGLPPADRDRLMRRLGRALRRVESLGFSHFDAKATNWMVFDDPRLGPTPVLLDCDGVRPYRRAGVGLRRLARAIGEHPTGSPADADAITAGYEGR